MSALVTIVEHFTAVDIEDTVVQVTLSNEPGPQGPAGPGGGGGGAVDSVNGQTGVVVLDAADVGAVASPLVDADVPATIARDSEVTAAVAAEAALARDADNLTSGTVADARVASTIARDSEVTAAIAASEAGQVRDGDAAGGVLAGTYPNPSFAVDMATQAELDAVAATVPTTEVMQDLVGAMVAGNTETGVAVTYDDTNGKLDFVAEVTQAELDAVSGSIPTTEAIQDIVGAMVSGGTETGIAVTYDDTNARLDFVAEVTQAELDAKADDSAVVHDTGDETVAGVKTFTSDPIIPDEVYGVGWNGSLEPPTKNAVYDKIETLGGGSYTDEQAQDAVGTILVDSATIDFTYTDATPEITAIVKDGSITAAKVAADVATQAELDAVSAAIPNTEAIQDIVGGMVVGGTETGIAVTYDDTNGRLDFVAEVTQAELDAKANDADVVHDTGDETVAGVKTFTSGVKITDGPTTAYAGLKGVLVVQPDDTDAEIVGILLPAPTATFGDAQDYGEGNAWVVTRDDDGTPTTRVRARCTYDGHGGFVALHLSPGANGDDSAPSQAVWIQPLTDDPIGLLIDQVPASVDPTPTKALLTLRDGAASPVKRLEFAADLALYGWDDDASEAGWALYTKDTPAIGARAIIQSLTNGTIGLYVNGEAVGSQTADLLRVANAATIGWRIGKSGYMHVHKTSAPADGDVTTSTFTMWWTDTNGAAALNIKGKTANGTVVSIVIPVSGQAPTADADIANKAYVDAGGIVAINAQSGTTYTLVLADKGKAVQCTNASAITVTIPPNSSVAFPVGTVVEIDQMGAGTVTVAPGSGVTIRSRGSLLNLNGQYAACTIRKIATDEWLAAGDLA